MLKRLEVPLTETQQNMQLSDEVTGAMVLYKEHNDRYTFVGLHNPEIPDEEYRDGIVAMPLSSVFIRCTFLPEGTSVWNVIGSTGDILRNADGTKSKDWKRAWNGVWKKYTGCTIQGCSVSGGDVEECDTIIYGGHMQDHDPNDCKAQTGDLVYLIPICRRHNNSWVTDKLIVKGVYRSSPGSSVFGVPALVLNYEQPK